MAVNEEMLKEIEQEEKDRDYRAPLYGERGL